MCECEKCENDEKEGEMFRESQAGDDDEIC